MGKYGDKPNRLLAGLTFGVNTRRVRTIVYIVKTATRGMPAIGFPHIIAVDWGLRSVCRISLASVQRCRALAWICNSMARKSRTTRLRAIQLGTYARVSVLRQGCGGVSRGFFLRHGGGIFMVDFLHLLPCRTEAVGIYRRLIIIFRKFYVFVGTERHYGGVHRLNYHRCHALRQHAESLGRSPRQVDNSAMPVRTTVGNSYENYFARTGIGNLEPRAEWISAVGASHTVVMKTLAAAGTRSGELFGIIRRFTFLTDLRRQKGKT